MERDLNPSSNTERLARWLEAVWLSRYLNRELTESETQWFEAYALDKPDLIDQIEADTQLGRAFRFEKRNQHKRPTAVITTLPGFNQKPPIAPPNAGAKQMPADRQSSPRRSTSVRLAASLLVGIGGGWILQSVVSKNDQPALLLSPTRIIFDTMRGDGANARVEHAESRSAYVLVEAPVPSGAQQITLRMHGTEGQALLQAPDGFISFLVERKLLSTLGPTIIEYHIGPDKKTVPIDIPSAMRGAVP
jgi:hypothetical protein